MKKRIALVALLIITLSACVKVASTDVEMGSASFETIDEYVELVRDSLKSKPYKAEAVPAEYKAIAYDNEILVSVAEGFSVLASTAWRSEGDQIFYLHVDILMPCDEDSECTPIYETSYFGPFEGDLTTLMEPYFQS
jgi:hypothetical protein